MNRQTIRGSATSTLATLQSDPDGVSASVTSIDSEAQAFTDWSNGQVIMDPVGASVMEAEQCLHDATTATVEIVWGRAPVQAGPTVRPGVEHCERRIRLLTVAAPMIAPSILSADFARLGEEAEAVAGSDWLHVDVMDAHFVPNLTLGLPVVQSLLKATDIPLDCHLMIEDPARWAPPYAEAGAYNVTFHAEATDDPIAVAKDIRAAGARAGLSVKPGTPIEPYLEILREFDTLLVMSVEPGFGGQSFMPEVLSKARAVRRLVDAGELTLVVEIDGGINADTIEQAAEAGIDCFVAGSAVYGTADPAATVRALRAQAAGASKHLSL